MKNKQMKEWLRLYAGRVRSEGGESVGTRNERMQRHNPRYILRNWIAQSAIEKAEADDFSEVRFLLELFRNPYQINKEAEQRGYASRPPDWSKRLTVSCSS